jgi:hypothetical protein
LAGPGIGSLEAARSNKGLFAGFSSGKEESSFSEEKAAKRLLFLALLCPVCVLASLGFRVTGQAKHATSGRCTPLR